MFDVKDFGAVGDGVNDDTPAFQEALKAIEALGPASPPPDNTSRGAVLFIPYGTYKLSQTLQIKTQCILQGVSGWGGYPGSKLIFNDSVPGKEDLGGIGGIVIEFPGGSNSVIRDLGLFGIGQKGTTKSAHGVQLNARASIDDCYIKDFPGNGIHIEGEAHNTPASDATNWSIRNAWVQDCGGDGLHNSGGDAHVGTAVAVMCRGNKGWAILSDAKSPSTYVSCLSEGNGDRATGNGTGFNVKNGVLVGCHAEEDQQCDLGIGALAIGGTIQENVPPKPADPPNTKTPNRGFSAARLGNTNDGGLSILGPVVCRPLVHRKTITDLEKTITALTLSQIPIAPTGGAKLLNWIPLDNGLRGGVDENGRLWIGNNVPSCALHVRDNINDGGLIVEGDRLGAEETIAIKLSAGYQVEHDAGLRRYTMATAGGKKGALELFTSDNGNVLIKLDAGKIGVGTTEPVCALHVRDKSNGGGLVVEGDQQAAEATIAIRLNASSQDHDAGLRRYTAASAAGKKGALELFTSDDGNLLITLGAGKIGVGTTDPSCALHVRDNIDGGGLILEGDQQAAEETIAIKLSAGYQDQHYGGLRRYTEASAGGKKGARELFTQDKNFLINLVTGKVGVGTTDPVCGLHVRDNIDGGGLLLEGDQQAAGETIGIRLSAGYQDEHYGGLRRYTMKSAGGKKAALELFTSDDGNLIISLDAGKMGVGTTDPQAKLDVHGDMRIGNARIQSGDQDPQNPKNNIIGNIGDIYLNTAGNLGTTLFVKEQDNGKNTGWKAK